jgi:hypothetical protein
MSRDWMVNVVTRPTGAKFRPSPITVTLATSNWRIEVKREWTASDSSLTESTNRLRATVKFNQSMDYSKIPNGAFQAIYDLDGLF